MGEFLLNTSDPLATHLNLTDLSLYFKRFRYGDRAPVTIPGRIYSMIWTLIGLVITGITVGSLTASFTILSADEDISLYNTDVSCGS